MDDYLKNRYQQAQLFYSHGAYKISLDIINDLIIKYPDLADLHNFKGVIQTSNNKFKDAKLTFNKAI